MAGRASSERSASGPATAPLTEDAIALQAAQRHLDLLGGFAATGAEGLPQGVGTVLLFGAKEPGFWDHLRQSPEWLDAGPNPIDRWSRRNVAALATALHPGAEARFPFGGPPHDPFPAWALRSGRCHPSPVGLLVHDRAGLMVSFRGAIWLPGPVALSAPLVPPCLGCPAPCLTACPVGALGTDGYDIPACRAYLNSPEGAGCMAQGCAVRRACPVGRDIAPPAGRAAHHMHHFL